MKDYVKAEERVKGRLLIDADFMIDDPDYKIYSALSEKLISNVNKLYKLTTSLNPKKSWLDKWVRLPLIRDQIYWLKEDINYMKEQITLPYQRVVSKYSNKRRLYNV